MSAPRTIPDRRSGSMRGSKKPMIGLTEKRPFEILNVPE